MNERIDGPVPTEIKLHQQTGVLEMLFSDGAQFHLPAEYLRVLDRVPGDAGQLVSGKERVRITRIIPEGNRAIRLVFNDGFQGSVLNWADLHELGRDYADRWAAYLDRLGAAGIERKVDESGPYIRILYFARLVDRLGRGREDVTLPGTVTNVRTLLAWLRSRGGEWATYLVDGAVNVTINREFTKPESSFKPGDEVAIVPNHPG